MVPSLLKSLSYSLFSCLGLLVCCLSLLSSWSCILMPVGFFVVLCSIFSYASLLRSFRKGCSELQMSSWAISFPQSNLSHLIPSWPNQLLLCGKPYAGGVNWPLPPLKNQLPLVLGKPQPTKLAFVFSFKLSWSRWLKGSCHSRLLNIFCMTLILKRKSQW